MTLPDVAAGRILDAEGLSRAVRRLAHEVLERHPALDGVVVAGIRRGGVPVARAVAAELGLLAGAAPPLAELDVSGRRDDRPRRPARPRQSWAALDRTETPPAVDGATVILVDDVLHTGRTLRAALDVLSDHGRPAAVEPLVLVDRGRRELPLRATYVGKNIPSASGDWVHVRMDGRDAGAWLVPAEVRRAAGAS